METSLRLVLILIGLIIVVGIIWDSRRNRGSGNVSTKKRGREEISLSSDSLEEDDLPFDEMVISTLRKQEPDVKLPPVSTSNNAPIIEKKAPKQPEVIALSVMARHPNTFTGRKLVEALNKLDIFYGEMQIFHRYENSDGTGEHMFSLVSAVEPGYFEISKIETCTTPGVVMFFTISSPKHSMAALELMLKTAKSLAQLLNADVKDDQRRPLSPQMIEVYREKARNAWLDPHPRAMAR